MTRANRDWSFAWADDDGEAITVTRVDRKLRTQDETRLNYCVSGDRALAVMEAEIMLADLKATHRIVGGASWGIV